MISAVLAYLGGYLAGSVPFAFLLARRVGIDVRTAGSGNVGAANVLRTTGAWRGVIVMALDVAKGALAVLLAGITAGERLLPRSPARPPSSDTSIPSGSAFMEERGLLSPRGFSWFSRRLRRR